LLLVTTRFVASAAAAPARTPPAQKTRSESVKISGEIVDCADYLMTGRHGAEQRYIQARNIDQGMPACLVADKDGQIYLLMSPSGQAREKFSPTDNFIGGGTLVTGTVYERGAFKSLVIDRIDRAASQLATKDARHLGNDSLARPKKQQKPGEVR